MDSPTATLIGILRDRVENLRSSGNMDEAVHAATAAVEKSQQALAPDLESIDAFASALEIRGDIYRELEKFDLACNDYQEAIDQLETRPDRFDQIGRLHAGLGAAFDGLGQADQAAKHWQCAISYFERNEPPLLFDIAAIANNLAFLYRTSGDFDAAETYFLRALEILHSQLGQEHEETATVSSNLGALYQAAGYFEQSREMHMIALETRRNLFGEVHPDTAQSHNNLAFALLNTGDRSRARSHFEKALSDFQALGPEFSDDLEAVAFNYCAFLREEGEHQLADSISDRIQKTVEAAVC
jgi:tetratricopeptide (TPR) repeat protein